MMDLFFKIQGMNPTFTFSNGYGEQVHAYLLHECECSIWTSHDFILVYNLKALPGHRYDNAIRLDRVAVNDNCKIINKKYDETWHHNFWVKCSEYFAEKHLLED